MCCPVVACNQPTTAAIDETGEGNATAFPIILGWYSRHKSDGAVSSDDGSDK